MIKLIKKDTIIREMTSENEGMDGFFLCDLLPCSMDRRVRDTGCKDSGHILSIRNGTRKNRSAIGRRFGNPQGFAGTGYFAERLRRNPDPALRNRLADREGMWVDEG
jgi:hypothetical protein